MVVWACVGWWVWGGGCGVEDGEGGGCWVVCVCGVVCGWGGEGGKEERGVKDVGQEICQTTPIRPWPAGRLEESGLAKQWNAALLSRTQWKKYIRAVVVHNPPPADDVVMLRTVVCCWNVETGMEHCWIPPSPLEAEIETVRENWHYDSDGKCVHTMLWKRNPILASSHSG